MCHFLNLHKNDGVKGWKGSHAKKMGIIKEAEVLKIFAFHNGYLSRDANRANHKTIEQYHDLDFGTAKFGLIQVSKNNNIKKIWW